jgi:hypothetical protein
MIRDIALKMKIITNNNNAAKSKAESYNGTENVSPKLLAINTGSG